MLGLFPTILLSAGAGIAFAAMGMAYRWGEAKHIKPQMVFWAVSVLGAGLFLTRCIHHGQFWHIPPRVIFWAVIGGVGQYLAVALMTPALKRGAFGPVWCALTLNFIPVALFSAFFTEEKSSPFRWISMALAIACVVVASMDPHLKKDGDDKKQHSVLTYATLLLILMIANGIANVGLKDLGLPHPPQGPLVPIFRDSFMCLFYAVIFLSISAEWLVRRKNIPQLRVVAGPAVLAAIGSLVGVGLLMEASRGPSFLSFIVSSILSVLGGFIGAAVFFKDKLTWVSAIVIALGIASVVCTAF